MLNFQVVLIAARIAARIGVVIKSIHAFEKARKLKALVITGDLVYDKGVRECVDRLENDFGIQTRLCFSDDDFPTTNHDVFEDDKVMFGNVDDMFIKKDFDNVSMAVVRHYDDTSTSAGLSIAVGAGARLHHPTADIVLVQIFPI